MYNKKQGSVTLATLSSPKTKLVLRTALRTERSFYTVSFPQPQNCAIAASISAAQASAMASSPGWSG